MVKRLHKSALVTVLIALCLLLALAMVVAFVPSVRVQAEDGTTTTKYITAAGELSETATEGDGSIAVDVDADGTLVFNRIEQFNAVENTPKAEGAAEDPDENPDEYRPGTYTIKPYGYNYNGGLIVYPAFKGQIVKYIVNRSTTDGSVAIDINSTLRWRVVVPATVTKIDDFAFAYKIGTHANSAPGEAIVSTVYGWNSSNYDKLGANGMVGLAFEKGDTDYKLTLGAGIMGYNAVSSFKIPARVFKMASAPTGWDTTKFKDYYDEIEGNPEDIRYLTNVSSNYARGRVEQVLTGSYEGTNKDFAEKYIAMKNYHIGTFTDCYATDITFENECLLTKIPAYAFAVAIYYEGMDSAYTPKAPVVPKRTSIEMPGNVETIEPYAFSRNYCLSNITFNNVETIKSNAFYMCYRYKPDSKYKTDYLTGAKLEISDSVTTIESKAFNMHSGISEVTVGSGLKTIASDAINTNITTPIKPEITRINLTKEALANWCSIDFGTRNGLINSNTSTTNTASIYLNGKLLENLDIPEGVTEIKAYAFQNCNSLNSVQAHSELATIGASAFNGCAGLQSFTFPDKVAGPDSEYAVDGVDSALTAIGENAFKGTGLTSVVIPESVTSIGTGAFANCNSIKEVFNLSSIDYTFNSDVEIKNEYHGDTSLKKVGDFVFQVEKDGKPLEKPVLIGYNGPGGAVTLPAGYENKSYDIEANLFKNNASIVFLRIPADSVDEIGDNAFMGATNLQSVIIDNGIGSIGASAFEGCTELVSVVIQGAISTINARAFYNCANLSVLNINESGLTAIGQYAFYNCSSLTEISMPDTVSTIGMYAFYNCSSLSNLKLSEIVTAIPDHAFYQTALTSVVIPDSVTTIGPNAFSHANLTEVYIGKNVTTIEYAAFANNSNLAVVEFAPDSVLKTVGGSVFMSSGEIKRLAYPDSVQSIGSGRLIAAASWSRLVELRLPASYVAPADNKEYEISGDNNNMSVYLPKVTAGNRANYGANMLGFLVRLGHTYEGMNSVMGKLYKGVGCIIAPDKEAYDLMLSAINSFEKGSDFTAYDATEYIAKLFVSGEVTYKLSDKDGNPAGTATEQKLLSEAGAVMAYAPVTEDGATHWVKLTSVTFPSDIDGFDASGVTWKYGEQTVDKDFVLTVANYGEYVFTAQLTINAILFPFEDNKATKVYDGKAWVMPERYANLLSFTVEGGKDPVNVDEYVLTVSLKNADDRWSDSTNAAKTVTLTITPAEFAVVWKMTGDWKGDAKTYNGVSIAQEFGLKLGLNNEIDITGDDIEIYDDVDSKVDDAVNAGEYRVVIKSDVLEEYGNYTFTNTEQLLIINKRTIDISKPANLTFGLQGNNADLRDGWLYIYNDTPYISAQSGLGTPTIINVKKSYVRFREDTEMTIAINNIPSDAYGAGKVYAVGDYDGNTGTEVGTYQASVTLSSANYSFITTNEDSGELLARGLVIVINTDGTATVNKTWYIVRMENSLVDDEGNDYEIIAGWTYGDSVNIAAPLLEVGDEEQLKTKLEISLILNGTTVADFNVDQFAYYINSSMPAGNYDLVFNLDTVVVNDIIHAGFDDLTYHFTVATLTNADMYAALNEKLQNATFEYKYIANRPQFLGNLNAVDLVKFSYGTRQGYWGDAAASKYFSDKATITFNVEGMQSADYREASGYTAEDDYVPMNVGTYVVYYQVNVGSYTSLVANILSATSNRKNYKFTVVIYDELDIPTVSSAGLEYTGNRVLPDIENNEQYAIVWSDTDAYITGGTHSVSFKLYDNVHYRWKGVAGDTVLVEFTIAKANNDFTTALNMLGWNFETFDAAINNIRAAVRYLDNNEAIHFRVVRIVNENETAAVDGLADFTVDGNGRVSEDVAAVLNALKVGNYTLYAKVNGTGNYKEYERNIDFAVSKAINTWADGDDDLVLPSWIVGKYDKKENPIVINAAHGQVNIIVADINGKEYYNSTTGLNKLNECEVGKYLVKAWVDETEDFAALPERTFTIEVLEKIGLPWWATLLITVGALLVAALIIFILWKKGVFQILTEKIVVAIRTKASVDATIASVRAAKKMEEGKQSVADAKRRERIAAMREKAKAQRALPPEERAALLEERARAHEERAEKNRARSEAIKAQAAKLRGEDVAPAADEPTAEAAATEAPETPTEE